MISIRRSSGQHIIIGLLILLFFPSGIVNAQSLPVNQPEQDACNALVLCGSSFTTPYSYQGIGRINNLSTTPCGAGEDNAMWLKLTVNNPGRIVFTITPVSGQDDYDFAVLNITGGNCNNLSSGSVVRCNFNNNQPGSNVNGVIGLAASGTQSYIQGGAFGSSFCQPINATTGQVFLIMINNFGNYQTGGPSSGFTIDFSGSTATFNSPEPPRLESVQAPVCNYKNEVVLQLSTEVKCSSIAANGSDFQLTPSGTIASASGINCSGTQGYTDKVRLVFSSPLAPGTYTVQARQGSDGNTLLDLCNNALRLPDQLTFTVPALSRTVSMSRCANQLPFSWNGVTVTAGGPAAAVVHHITQRGCDSVTTLDLTIIPNTTRTVTQTICTRQLPYIWNGITVTSGGNAAAVYTTRGANSCDSITTLNLNVVQEVSSTVTMRRCPNQLPFTWNGIRVTAPGPMAAVFRTVSVAGCDSVVTLNLTLITPLSDSLTVRGCNEVSYNGRRYTADQVIIDTVQSRLGCDSIYHKVTIKVFQTPPPLRVSMDTAGCGTVLYNGITYTADTTITHVLLDGNGCDSVYRITNIMVYPNTPASLRIDTSACYWVMFEGGVYYRDTTLIKTYKNRLGCDSVIRTVYVDVEELGLILTASPRAIVKGESVELKSAASLSYRVISWSPRHLFPQQQQQFVFQRLRPDRSERYVVVAESDGGCIDSAEVWVTVDTLVPDAFIPNAFTPNGDGVNDWFRPKFYSERGHEIVNFRVVDRWGKVVFASVGTTTNGWDGTYNNQGTPAELGTYYYYLEVRFINGERKLFKGDVILIR